jgi:trans-aconitate 2-methyltransferase
MASWNPAQYRTFLEWRTRPSRDLAQRINIAAPRQIVDLGCGPGNSTAVCAERWPAASILGLDSSPEMIAAARAAQPDRCWAVGDIGEWAFQPSKPGEQVDLIFSSAALQWIEDHATVFPRLVEKLAPGGVLAAHMPAYDAIPNQTMRAMASSARWRRWFPDGRAKEWRSHPLEFYYAALARSAKWLDLWATDYLQIMPDLDGIVEWYKSTGLRPYLDRIEDHAQRQEFLAEYQSRLNRFYPNSEAGGVPFLFRRIFIVAGV